MKKMIKQKSSRRLMFVSVLFLVLMCIFAMGATGCGRDGESNPSSYDYLQQKILITGLTQEDFSVTAEELTKLESVTEKAEASRFNGEKVKIKATGPTLDTFLSKYGKKQSDFESIRFTADDQYSIAVSKEILESRKIILAYEDDGKPLDKKAEPIHVVIPEERAMYWVRMLKQIDFEKDAGAVAATKVVFLDQAIKTVPSSDYDDGGITDKAVKIKDLAGAYAVGETADKVFLSASDGLEKNETADNFLSAYIKYTGKESPKFLAPHFPEGMNIKGVVSMQYGDTLFYSLEEGSKTLKLSDSGGKEGVTFTDIVKKAGFKSGLTYLFTDMEKNQIKLTEEQLAKGSFTFRDGIWSFCYGPEQKQAVRGILTIETVN
jgi:hypothetical protein